MRRHYVEVMFEEIKSQNRLILEVVGSMQEHVAEIPGMKADIAQLKNDVATIKYALIDTNKQVHDHELRLTKLEATA